MIYLNDDIAGFDLQAALPMLSAQRLEQLQKFKHELGRKTCAMAYVAATSGARAGVWTAGATGVQPTTNTANPTSLATRITYFNLSAGRAGVICASSNGPVGIDIESGREYNDSLARYTT